MSVLFAKYAIALCLRSHRADSVAKKHFSQERRIFIDLKL